MLLVAIGLATLVGSMLLIQYGWSQVYQAESTYPWDQGKASAGFGIANLGWTVLVATPFLLGLGLYLHARMTSPRPEARWPTQAQIPHLATVAPLRGEDAAEQRRRRGI